MNGMNGADGLDGSVGPAGADGTPSLIAQTPLATGDTRCPGGGVLVQSGLDNGGGGGVSRDGVLQTGEVTATAVVCNGDTGARVGSMTPPPGAVGTDLVDVSGGNSDGGSAGYGGSVRLVIQQGTNGGHVKAFKTGKVDATFTTPATPSGDFGSNPFTAVTATVTVQSSNVTALPAGTLFISGASFYVAPGDNTPAPEVTGLTVPAGVTLTLPDMNPGEGLPLNIAIKRSVRNLGTLVVPPGNAAFSLWAGDFVGEVGSAIVAKGASSATGAGSNGSTFSLKSTGFILNRGTVDLSGGNGTTGGSGGRFLATANGGPLYNVGVITGIGGSGTGLQGFGGTGGSVELHGLSIFNSGAIDVSGGDSAKSSAGGGGSIEMTPSNSFATSTRNTATLKASGGSVSCPNCFGASGGNVRLVAYNGSALTSGSIDVVGGAGDVGGSGGSIEVSTTTSGNFGSSDGVPGSVWVSGSLKANGRSSANGAGSTNQGGGHGGTVLLSVANSYNTIGGGGEVVLFGCASINARGGNGGMGASGGQVTMEQSDNENNQVGGAVINTVDIVATGGNGDVAHPVDGSAVGGTGGSVTLQTHRPTIKWQVSFELVVNTGSFDLWGGSGSKAGQGGQAYLVGRDAASSTGAIKAFAGRAATVGGASGGSVQILSAFGVTTVAGSIDVNGGSTSSHDGGNGGDVLLRGTVVHNSATVTANGGSSDAVSEGSIFGGQGGGITLLSLAGVTDNTVAAPAGFSVVGGAGKTTGDWGFITIDGELVTSSWLH